MSKEHWEPFYLETDRFIVKGFMKGLSEDEEPRLSPQANAIINRYVCDGETNTLSRLFFFNSEEIFVAELEVFEKVTVAYAEGINIWHPEER